MFNGINNNQPKSNSTVEGIPFDQDTFENLVDCFTPKKDFHIILDCTCSDLDKFCKKVYGRNFSDTYDSLVKVSTALWGQTINKLARLGNQTAIKYIIDEHMSRTNKNNELKITICSDLPIDGDEPEEVK